MFNDKNLNNFEIVEETKINITNVIGPGETIGLIKNCGDAIKTQHERVIVYIAK